MTLCWNYRQQTIYKDRKVMGVIALPILLVVKAAKSRAFNVVCDGKLSPGWPFHLTVSQKYGWPFHLTVSQKYGWPFHLTVSLKYISKQLLTHCGPVISYGNIELVNIGSGNGLLSGSTKPLPEPMLMCHLAVSEVNNSISNTREIP